MSTPAESPVCADQLILKILESIAEARDVDVTDLPALASLVDVEGLERFLRSTSVSAQVEMDLYGCQVEIDEECNVHVSADLGCN